MSFLEKLLWRPRSSWLWKLNFQVHLWTGLVLTLYLILIGCTGSILVFRVELERIFGLRPWPVAVPHHPSARDVETALANVRLAIREQRIVSISTPTPDRPFFVAALQGPMGRCSVEVDPRTFRVSGPRNSEHSWLDVLADLHETLLAGKKGRIANGVGGAILVLINLTGLVIWWPGLKLWRRALIVDAHRSWRRVNFDLHRALGFWTLSIVTFWALSGIYFAWPAQVFALVNKFSPVVSAQPPYVSARPVTHVIEPQVSDLIAKAYALDPGSQLAAVNFPYSRRAPFEIVMQRANGIGREYSDTLYFSPWDGSHLKTWRYGVNESLGDWIIWLQVPLHFGTYWGLGIKIVWALLGISVPLLSITGMLLYWNRFLRHKF